MKNFQLVVPCSRVSRSRSPNEPSSSAFGGTTGWNPTSMTAADSARARRRQNESYSEESGSFLTKSTIVVVPPWAAATVPLVKSSAERVTPERRVLEVGVRVDAAGEHVAAGRVDDRGRRRRRRRR